MLWSTKRHYFVFWVTTAHFIIKTNGQREDGFLTTPQPPTPQKKVCSVFSMISLFADYTHIDLLLTTVLKEE